MSNIDDIKIGDCITNADNYPNLDSYFKNGPLKVINIKDGPDYAGGKFIICDYGLSGQGFYLNAVKKAKCS